MDEKLLNSLIEYLGSLHHISADAIPDVDLYMDQVTSFMDKNLDAIKRHQEDKALTKTMINNYAKNKLLPPPVRKKYSKEHILMLLFIYYYKGILSLTDIETILTPINEKYFHAEEPLTLKDIYEQIFSLEDTEMQALTSDIRSKFDKAAASFPDSDPDVASLPEEDREELRRFALLGILGFDVYLKRQLMERIVDEMKEEKEQKLAEEAALKAVERKRKR